MATIADRRDAAATLHRLMRAVEQGELDAGPLMLAGIHGAAVGLDPPRRPASTGPYPPGADGGRESTG